MGVKFRAGTLEFNASVAEAGESASAQTGATLRSLTIQFRAQKAPMHEQAVEEAQQCRSGGLFSLGEAGEQQFEWRVRESSWAYVGTEPWGINHHVWRIEQLERVACERLVIGCVELEPYEYAEDSSEDGAVRLVARALIAQAQLEALTRIAGAIDVVRLGISDVARKMSVSYVWGERPDGLAVAVRCEDVREPRVSLEGTTSASDDRQDLVAILQVRGVLDDSAMEELRHRRHARRHVSDIDGWPLQK